MNLLKKENVQIVGEARDWKDAIRISVFPLEKDGYVEERYKEEVISNVEELGPYIVIAPNIALPHARPEQGVLRSQIAVTLFENDVRFDNKESTARLFITLAAADSNSHLDALMAVSELLQNDEMVNKILNSKYEEELHQYFS